MSSVFDDGGDVQSGGVISRRVFGMTITMGGYGLVGDRGGRRALR